MRITRATAIVLIALSPLMAAVASKKVESMPFSPATHDALVRLSHRASDFVEETQEHEELISDKPHVMAPTLTPRLRQKVIALAHEWIPLLDTALSEMKTFGRKNKDALPKCARLVEQLSRPDYESALAKFEAKPMGTPQERLSTGAAAIGLSNLFVVSVARIMRFECALEAAVGVGKDLRKSPQSPTGVEDDD